MEKSNMKGMKMTTAKLVIIVKILLTIILIGTICAITLIIYLFKGDVKAKVPGYVKKEYNLNKYEVANRPVYAMAPKNGVTNELVIMYIHGGSYVADLEKEHWKTCGDIVNRLGCTIILPDYPLTPKYNYKDTFNMMETLYKKIIDKVDSSNFVIMGDSAGGGLALALVQEMGEENIKMPNQTILISPWLDVRMNNPEIEKVAKNDPMLNKSALKLAGENYAGKDGIDSYLVNPIDGPLEKLKNVSVFTGTYDILNPDVKILEERAKKVGNTINIYETEKATHIWLLYKYKDKENDELVEEPYNKMIELLKNN